MSSCQVGPFADSRRKLELVAASASVAGASFGLHSLAMGLMIGRLVAKSLAAAFHFSVSMQPGIHS